MIPYLMISYHMISYFMIGATDAAAERSETRFDRRPFSLLIGFGNDILYTIKMMRKNLKPLKRTARKFCVDPIPDEILFF